MMMIMMMMMMMTTRMRRRGGEEGKGEGQEDEEECEHLDINNRQLILCRTRQADTCKPLFPKPAPFLSNLLSLHGDFPVFFV